MYCTAKLESWRGKIGLWRLEDTEWDVEEISSSAANRILCNCYKKWIKLQQ